MYGYCILRILYVFCEYRIKIIIFFVDIVHIASYIVQTCNKCYLYTVGI